MQRQFLSEKCRTPTTVSLIRSDRTNILSNRLTYAERAAVVREVADRIGGWGFARLFAECIDKVHFDPIRSARTVAEQAFEQVISRFQRYLTNTEQVGGHRNHGLLVHDNNKSVARKHTDLMRHFHEQGTLWTAVDRIIETPLFVDSRLTRMVQIVDLCSVALRKFCENGESNAHKHQCVCSSFLLACMLWIVVFFVTEVTQPCVSVVQLRASQSNPSSQNWECCVALNKPLTSKRYGFLVPPARI